MSPVVSIICIYGEKSIWLYQSFIISFEVYYTSLTDKYWPSIDSLLHLLKQPIFNKIRLVAFHLWYNRVKWFLQKRVRMTLIHCSLLPMVIIAKRSLQADDTKHWCFSVAMWINLNISHCHYKYCRSVEASWWISVETEWPNCKPRNNKLNKLFVSLTKSIYPIWSGAAFTTLLFLHNLQIGPMSYSVCHWQAFPA